MVSNIIFVIWIILAIVAVGYFYFKKQWWIMVEFEVDMEYLAEYDELDCVILHDKYGEMEPMKFVPEEKQEQLS